MSSVASQIAQGGSAAKSSGAPGPNRREGFLDGDCPDFRPTGHRPKVGLDCLFGDGGRCCLGSLPLRV